MGTTSFLKRAQALLHIRNQLVRECLAELLAVFVLIVSGAHGWARADRGDGGRRWESQGSPACPSPGVGGFGAASCSPRDLTLPGLPLRPCSRSVVHSPLQQF